MKLVHLFWFPLLSNSIIFLVIPTQKIYCPTWILHTAHKMQNYSQLLFVGQNYKEIPIGKILIMIAVSHDSKLITVGNLQCNQFSEVLVSAVWLPSGWTGWGSVLSSLYQYFLQYLPVVRSWLVFFRLIYNLIINRFIWKLETTSFRKRLSSNEYFAFFTTHVILDPI